MHGTGTPEDLQNYLDFLDGGKIQITNEKKINIVWKIIAYKNPGQQIWLINYILSNSTHSVFIHYNKNSSKTEFQMIQNAFQDNDRVFCYQKFKTSWGSYGLTQAPLFLTEKIIASGIVYDYAIDISGDVFFTQPLYKLEDFLQKNYGTTFILASPTKPIFLTDEKEKEEVYDRILKNHVFSRFYLSFFPKYYYGITNINPELTWLEISRILIHFTIIFEKVNPNLYIPLWKKIYYHIFSSIMKIHAKIFGIILPSFGILRINKKDVFYNILRASCYAVTFHEVNSKIIQDYQNVKKFVKKFKLLFAPEEIVIPSLIYHYCDKEQLNLTTDFGAIRFAQQIDQSQMFSLANDPHRYFARNFTDIKSMQIMTTYYKS